MPPLSQADKEWVRLTVKAVITETLREHVRTCPNVARIRAFIFGLVCGVAVVSGAGGVAVARLVLGS